MDFLQLLLYWLELFALSLGGLFLCGLSVDLLFRVFRLLCGNGKGRWIADLTAPIGTPIHEFGHAVMCPLFCHRITKVKLWDPKAENGAYGYVNHSYSKHNLWAVFGNLFIGLGPLFSGLAVTVFLLWLCFPNLWTEYLQSTNTLVAEGNLSLSAYLSGVGTLLLGIPKAFANDFLRSLLGAVILLPISMHVTLSPADIKGSLSSLPLYLFLMAILSLATFWNVGKAAVLSFFLLANLRLLSLFLLVLAFASLWVIGAALVRGIRIFVGWF